MIKRMFLSRQNYTFRANWQNDEHVFSQNKQKKRYNKQALCAEQKNEVIVLSIRSFVLSLHNIRINRKSTRI